MTIRDIEKRLDRLNPARPAGFEIEIKETVVGTEWEPDAEEATDVPEPGTKTTRVYRGDRGEWTTEGNDDDLAPPDETEGST